MIPVPSLNRSARLRALLAGLGFGLLASSAFAHGTLLEPMSRVYRVYKHNVEAPTAPWAKAALGLSSKTAFYTWNQVSHNIPGYDHRSAVPDGQLASGGNPTYAGLDLPRTDWPATSVAPGNYQLLLWATAPHEPNFIDIYITKPGYDPTKPLTWDGMEKIGSKVPYWKEAPTYWRINVTLPERTGKHVLWLVWQRIDPVGEAFFMASDLAFDGSVTENVVVPIPETVPEKIIPTPPPEYVTPTPPAGIQTQIGDVRLDFSSDSAWVGGYRAAISITNLGTTPLQNWKVGFTGDFVVSSIWDGRYVCAANGQHTVAYPVQGATLAPGATATFGFVTAGAPTAPGNFKINGETVTPPPNPPTPVASFKTELRFDSVWGTGFTGTLRITNTGTKAVDGWTLVFEAPFKIGSLWNGVYAKADGAHVVTPASWNKKIEPGKSIDVGFSATGAATPVADILVRTTQ